MAYQKGDVPVDDQGEATKAQHYFNADEERLGDPIVDYSIKKADVRWSEGVEDEENLELADADQEDALSEHTALPEMLPIDLVESPTPEQLDGKSSQRYLTE